MNSIQQAVILAGGPGLRMRPLTNDRPKPMVLVNGRPFLDYLIDLLKSNGVEEIVFLLGYMADKITDHIGDGTKHGIRAKYWIGEVTDGTGTRIREAKDMLAEEFLLLYCDNYLNFNLDELYQFHRAHQASATVTVYANRHGITKNNMFVDEKGYVTKYDKSRQDQAMNGVDAGFFIIKRDDILPLMPKENFFFEEAVMQALISQRKLAGCMTERFYFSIGSPARLQVTEEFLKPKKVVFISRDGVINKKIAGGAGKAWEEFAFLPGAVEALASLTKAGYAIYVVSNQDGVSSGVMSQDALHEINRRMEEELKKSGAIISATYYCPHAAGASCDCRLPKPGLLIQAALDHHVNLADAVFIGKDGVDAAAGKAAGCRTIILSDNESFQDTVKKIIS